MSSVTLCAYSTFLGKFNIGPREKLLIAFDFHEGIQVEIETVMQDQMGCGYNEPDTTLT